MTERELSWLMFGVLIATIVEAIYPTRDRVHAVRVAIVWALVLIGRLALVAFLDGR